MTIVNTVVWYLNVVKTADPKSYHHKEEKPLFFFTYMN